MIFKCVDNEWNGIDKNIVVYLFVYLIRKMFKIDDKY